MNEFKARVKTTLRIPGKWTSLGEITKRVPTGFQLTPEYLVLPDGTPITVTPLQPDDQFPDVFRCACRQPPTKKELAAIKGYKLSIGLTGPGGSMSAALKMMQAGAAIVRAGGAGVFIDNSSLSHGGGNWIEMTEDGSSDAVSYAFVGIVGGREEYWTIGMHVMGLPDLLMQFSDVGEHGENIVDLIRYLARGEQKIEHGQLVGDETGPQFKAILTKDVKKALIAGPMQNPFGRIKLLGLDAITENN